MPEALHLPSPDVTALAGLALASAVRPVVLIDGRSGAGKTTIGRALAEALGAQYVGLDDVYPGWEGLARASETVERRILDPDAPGYRRWDWSHSEPADWRALSPVEPLVVEGAGALTPGAAARASLCVWVELPEAVRRERLRGRSDAASYLESPWWAVWAAQEERHIARHDPRSLADVVVAG